MNRNDEILFLKKRVAELEKQLANLRLSRRVLMDLLEQVEKEKNNLAQQLKKRYKSAVKYKKNLAISQPAKKEMKICDIINIHDYIK